MNEISKELLKNVLQKEIREFVIEKNELRYILEEDTNSIPELYSISIYELAFKCKEWAFNLDKQLIIKSYTVKNAGVCEVKDKMGIHIETFDAKTEVDAIIETCMWILETEEFSK